LEPLWRFLQSRVGSCWDNVYSEIRANLSPKNAVQMHVVQHLKSQIAEDTYIGEDGCVYRQPKYSSGPTNLEEPVQYDHQFYIHPVTRELCVSPRKTKRNWKKEPKSKFQISDLVQYRLIEDVWYVVTFEKIPKELGIKERYQSPGKRYGVGEWSSEHLDFDRVGDILFPNGLRNYAREAEYGFTNIRAVSKRQLGKRELRHIKTLLNPA
jgi:hypothetical protein